MEIESLFGIKANLNTNSRIFNIFSLIWSYGYIQNKGVKTILKADLHIHSNINSRLPYFPLFYDSVQSVEQILQRAKGYPPGKQLMRFMPKKELQ